MYNKIAPLAQHQITSVKQSAKRLLVEDEYKELRGSLALALGLAIFWWLVVVIVFRPSSITLPWVDQMTYQEVGRQPLTPFNVPRYVNVPWTALFLAPFSIFPLSISVLLQLCLWFVMLTLICYKLGGGRSALLLVLTSYIAFDNALELSLDWIAASAILVPPMFIGPLVLVKPQISGGLIFVMSLKQIIFTGFVTLIVLLLSFVVWGFWFPDMTSQIDTYLVDAGSIENINIAPSHHLPFHLWLIPAIVLGGIAFKAIPIK